MIYLKEFNTAEEYAAFVESGQMKRPNVSLVNEPFTTYYNKYIPLGVFIQHIDGTLYTEADWTSGGFSNDQANGVAVVTNKAKFVISKEALGSALWSPDESLVDDILSSSNSSIAKTDFNGQQNTDLMLAIDSEAGGKCANFTFPNGEKGYLPALGEWDIAYQNKDAVNQAMTLIGGTGLGSNTYWSSTQFSANDAWCLKWVDGTTKEYRKASSRFSVRAFSALPL